MNNDALLIADGKKKDVFRSLRVLNNFNRESQITIVTDKSNFDMFSHFTNRNIKSYNISAETYIILKNRYYKHLFDMSRTELSCAIADRIKSSKYTGICLPGTSSLAEIILSQHSQEKTIKPLENYYFEQIPYPIDSVHSMIQKRGDVLIGINIGEDENTTKKMPVSMICNIANKISTLHNIKILFFGTEENELRAKMIENQLSAYNYISCIGRIQVPVLAQMLDLCDIVVSTNNFGMHLSLAVGTYTIGIFANRNNDDVETISHLFKINIQKKENRPHCHPCDEYEECTILNRDGDPNDFEMYCYNHIDTELIIKSLSLMIREIKEK